MKQFAVGLAVFSLALAASAPASAESRDFDLPAFDRIDISAGIHLVAEVGGDQAVSVETDFGDFSDLEIRVKNDALYVSRKYNRLRWHGKKSNYKVFVHAPALEALDASSGSHARIANISSAAFMIDLSSGAFAELAGDCENCNVDISSGASLDARDLACESAVIDVSSGGSGKLTVTQSVIADASSGGYVAVYGDPGRVDVDKSSGGRIKIISAAHQANND